jgi:hypothetical protein
MLNKCTSLIKVFMPSFVDNKITDMSRMFEECYSLKNINFLYSFNMEDVKNISYMFYNCCELEEINLLYLKLQMFKICQEYSMDVGLLKRSIYHQLI